jgi:hypothetical protein
MAISALFYSQIDLTSINKRILFFIKNLFYNVLILVLTNMVVVVVDKKTKERYKPD